MRLGFDGTCFLSGLLALPLSGAGLTFFAAAKKVSKESSFQPPKLTGPSLAFDWDWRWRVSVALTVEPGLARGPTVATRSTTDRCSSHTSVLALRAQTLGASGRRRESRHKRAQATRWFFECEPHVGANRARTEPNGAHTIPGSPSCHSGSASQARFHREGDTYSPAPICNETRERVC